MLLLQILSASLLLVRAASGVAISQQPLQFPLDDSAAIKKLHASVGNRLISTGPIAKPCFPPTFPITRECREVNRSKIDDDWTTDQPGGHFYSNWASCQANDETCAIPQGNGTIPENAVCHQGSVPSMMLEVEDADHFVKDIQAAFNYSRESKRPLVIRNTGHDWKGRSSGPGSLALWTHKMQAPAVPIEIEENFVPAGCENETKETVLHFGAGQQWGKLYKFAYENGLTVVGGTCPTVGVAGWLQGGGHSPMTPKYGMGVDNIQQLEIVTPKNGTVIASACQNEELFFAVRGGGGGTFGVITKLTYRAFRSVPIQDFKFEFNNLNEAQMRTYFNVVTANSVAWSRHGWGGYMMANDTGFTVKLINPDVSSADATRQMEPLISFLNATHIKYSMTEHPSWYNYTKVNMAVHPAYWSMNPASRLLSSEAFTDEKRSSLVDALVELYKDKLNMWLMFVAPTTYNQVVRSSLHPTWREAVLSVRAHAKWDQFDDSTKKIEARTHFEKVHDSFGVIRNLAPDMGVSISEADIWEDKPESHFWGTHYDELVKIKNQVDPENLLTNYGAINWNKEDERFRCYPKKRK